MTCLNKECKVKMILVHHEEQLQMNVLNFLISLKRFSFWQTPWCFAPELT